jgi:hypothetical protein
LNNTSGAPDDVANPDPETAGTTGFCGVRFHRNSDDVEGDALCACEITGRSNSRMHATTLLNTSILRTNENDLLYQFTL